MTTYNVLKNSKIRFVGNKSKRSIVSCNECRRRKKRCDEKRPKCSACVKRRVNCEYYKDLKENKKNKKIEEIEETKKISTNLKDNDKFINQNDNEVILDINIINNDNNNNESNNDVGDIDIDNQIVIIDKNDNISPEWNKFMIFSPTESTNEFQPLDSPINNFFNYNSNINSEFNNFNNIEFNNVDNLFNNLNNDLNFEIDLEFIAKSIIESFIRNDINFEFKNKFKDKFLKSFSLLLPLTKTSKPILIILSTWILSIKNDIKLSKFIDESLKICNKLEFKIDYSEDWNEDDLINLIVCLTGLTIISSNNSDTALWKDSFERLYSCLRKIGLEMLFFIIKNNNNKKIMHWVINWFFYQDIFKMIKVTSNRLLGPLFSKKEYLKFMKSAEKEEENDNNNNNNELLLNKCFDNSISCCINLFLVLGEINALYDQFIIKIQKPIKTYYQFILPIMNSLNEDEQIKFVNSEIYLNYELIRFKFHSWVQDKTLLLEKRILDCSIFNNGIGPIEEDMIIYFKVMKLSVLLYMKFKIKELTATNYEIKQIVLDIFDKMRFLINIKKFNNKLLFPLLMIGANVCEYRDKIMIKGFYIKMLENSGYNKKNLQQVFTIIQEFWKLNPNGVSFEMWQNIINKYDWNVCIV